MNRAARESAAGGEGIQIVQTCGKCLVTRRRKLLRGTGIGTLFGAMPGTGPTITTFIAYALEHKISKTPERFGKGAIEGVAAPESAASRHRFRT